jgi:general secretion pathway protein I
MSAGGRRSTHLIRPRRIDPGFTLIEVLVALAIVAVALAAGMRALAQSADGATSLKARTLALWVAQNELAKAQLADPPPSAGTTNGEAVQAGMRFSWRETISPTPNPALRKVDIVVAEPGVPDYALARLAGYFSNAGR